MATIARCVDTSYQPFFIAGRPHGDISLSRDPYVLVACIMFAALLLALGNLLADVLLALADPRIRHMKRY
jgi:hypothetical protein